MGKDKIRSLIIAILFGSGVSFFTCTQYLGVWTISIEKGVLLLSGGMVLVSGFFFLSLELIYKKSKIAAFPRSFSFLILLIVALSGGVLFIFPSPERITPDALQTLIIKPRFDGNFSPDANRILVEEIKINGKPVILNDIKPTSGWLLTPYGLESEPGSTNPLVLKNQGELQSDILVLFGKGPAYGSAQIALGWHVQQINLFQPDSESEVSITIPKENSGFWQIGFYLSLWITISGILLIIAMLILSEHLLSLIPEMMTRLGRSIFFWILLSILFWYGF
jgi:hypothetical protein